MRRAIVYVDPPAFCTTVEGLAVPALRHRPVAVAPPGADRATVLALSPEARAAGIVRGMPVRLARKRCPDLVLRPPNPRLYARASRALHEILRVYAPVIEPRGYGHAFLDLTGTEGLFGPPADVAHRLRREAWARLRLPLTVGIASNKLVSEAATRAGRCELEAAGDDGGGGGGGGRLADDLWPLSVGAGRERAFLAPREVAVLPDVPDPIRERLDDYQLDLIGQIAMISEPDLCAVFGAAGRTLGTRSRGIDPRPVLPPGVRAEYRLGHTLATDTNDVAVLHALLRRITERLGHRLRRRGLAARRIGVAVDYTDCAGASRRADLPEAMLDLELWQAARHTLAPLLARRVAVRRVEVTVDRLVEPRLQLELWADHGPPDSLPRAARSRALQQALDRITDRWPASAARAAAAAALTR